MGLLKYKEVYAAAAEVLGLALHYIAERENVSELYCVFDRSCLNSVYVFLWLLNSAPKMNVFKTQQSLSNRLSKSFKLLTQEEKNLRED